LGIALIAVGAWIWNLVAVVVAWMPILIVIGGAVVVILNLIGICGAGYDKTTPNEHKFKKALLLIYFFVFFIIDLVIAVASTLCIVAFDKVKSIVIAKSIQVKEWLAQYWPDIDGMDPDTLAKLVTNHLKIIGGIGIAFACIFVLALLLSGSLLGYQVVFTHTLTFGNLVLAVAGACLVALGFYVYHTGIINGKEIPLVIGLAGICIIVLAIVGFVSACCHEKSCARCFLCLYALVLCVLLFACIVLGIVVAAASDQLAEAIDSVCNTTTENFNRTCKPVYDLICSSTSANCTTDAKSIIDALKAYVKGNLVMVAAAAIWVGAVMTYLIIAACIVRSIPIKDPNAATKEEISATPTYNQAQGTPQAGAASV